MDGTKNSAGNITHSAEIIIDYQGHKECATAEVTNLGKNKVILRYMYIVGSSVTTLRLIGPRVW